MIALDTHALLWLALAPEKLSPPAARAIRESTGGLRIAAISLWEIAALLRRGAVAQPGLLGPALEQLVDQTGVLVDPLTVAIAALAIDLPRTFPRDPADRLIAATALNHAVPLVTADEGIRKSGVVTTIW
jgi:PIN domain nuclease of toxin-antitoxin system